MSLGYAEKLSYREDVGAVGQKEYLDSEQDIRKKSAELAAMVRLENATGAPSLGTCPRLETNNVPTMALAKYLYLV
jgi:hypothetical protein